MARTELQKQKDREYGAKKREEGDYIVYVPCRLCKKPSPTKKYKEKHHLKKGGITCKKCMGKIYSNALKKMHSNLSYKERSERGKAARACVLHENLSKGVEKQWAGFRADPEKYKQICEDKSVRMKKVWENYGDDIKNKIVDAFTKSHGKSRSIPSDKLKQAMIDAGAYDGFESEQIFHGFLPDEINHNLKIIVEMYGDLYHCNPRRYKDPNQYITALHRTVQEQWDRDKRRLACFYKHGYTVIIVWDRDFSRHPDREIKRITDEIAKKKEVE